MPLLLALLLLLLQRRVHSGARESLRGKEGRAEVARTPKETKMNR